MKNRHIIFIVFLIGMGLRTYNLGNFSLWFDEANSLLPPQNLKAVVEHMVGLDYPLPSLLYNAFIYYWKSFGSTEVVLRLSSVLFGAVSIIGIYNLGKLLFDTNTGLMSAFIIAISPFHIYYSQELRMYSLIVLLTIASIFFLVKAIKTRKRYYWVGYIVFNALGIYFHFMFSLVLLAEVFFFLVYWRRCEDLMTVWLLSQLGLLVLLIPWMRHMIYWSTLAMTTKAHYYWVPSWLPSVSLKNLFFTLKNFSAGYNATVPIYMALFILYISLFSWGVYKIKNKDFLTLSLLCLVVPVGMMFTISRFKVCYVDRYVIPSTVFYYLIVGAGLSHVGRKLKIPIILCIVTLSIFALRSYYINYLTGPSICHIGIQKKKEHREATNYIAENFRPGDGIFHTCRNTTSPLEYYFGLKYNDLPDKYSSVYAEGRNRSVLRFLEGTKEPLPFEYNISKSEFVDQSDNVSIKSYKRIWLVFSAWEFTGPNQPESDIVKWMDEHYMRVDTKVFSGIVIHRYAKTGN